jgi:hypothetical protein
MWSRAGAVDGGPAAVIIDEWLPDTPVRTATCR